MQNIKKELQCQGKKQKQFALPMQKLKRICIAYAKIKNNLHCNAKNEKNLLALPMEKIKRICIAHAKN